MITRVIKTPRMYCIANICGVFLFVEDEIVKKLTTVKGVGSVTTYGAQVREIQIKLDKEKMDDAKGLFHRFKVQDFLKNNSN